MASGVHAGAGGGIGVERRSAAGVTSMNGVSIAPDGFRVRHPAIQFTPSRLISAIITDRGVLRVPYDESIREVFR